MIGPNSKDRICLNHDCPDYQKRNTGNIIKKEFNANKRQPDQMLDDQIVTWKGSQPLLYALLLQFRY